MPAEPREVLALAFIHGNTPTIHAHTNTHTHSNNWAVLGYLCICSECGVGGCAPRGRSTPHLVIEDQPQ